MMKRTFAVAILPLIASLAFAEGTRTWEQSSFEQFEKGTPKGVAIRSDGSLELAPAFRQIYTTPSTYVWAVASDAQGNAYVASGAPARVYRVTPEGQTSIVFAPSELQVQALVVDKNGVIYAATSPDGKIYRIERRAAPAAPAASAQQQPAPSTAEIVAAQEQGNPKAMAAVDSNYTSTVFFDPKTKYIWALAFDNEGRLYVATGDRGEVFRVERNGTGSVFFKSDEAHIRALAFDKSGNLIAGSDGSGLVYRVAPSGEAFVLYSTPKKEITSLAIDGAGNIYVAAAGEKRPSAAGPLPSIGTTISGPVTTLPPSSGAPASLQQSPASTSIISMPPPATVSSGSEIYRIAPDGSPKRIWSSRDDIVYALGLDPAGRLLAGTGNKGKVYAIRPDSFTDLLKASANQVTGFAPAPKGGLYIATSNLGKLFILEESVQRDGTYESDVFDARIFSRWGRAELRSRGNVELFAHSGNVDNPDRNWSPWHKVDVAREAPIDAPPARYIQWRTVLHSGSVPPTVDSVAVNYLSKNVPPEIDDATVLVGTKFQGTPRTASEAANGGSSRIDIPTTAHDRDFISVRWNAHDENDDTLSYSLYYRGDNETRWKLLRSDLADRFYSFESDLLPDGGYSIRCVASDSPSHSPEEALSTERETSRFEVDNTPPRVENLAAVVENNQIHVTLTAADSFSVVRRAEYSLDAGEWRFLEPVGQLSDARVENYDFNIPLPGIPALAVSDAEQPAGKAKGKKNVPGPAPSPLAQTPQTEHTVVVRVYDRFDNMASAKVVVRPR